MSITQAQVDILAVEKSGDPLARGYAGMTDQQFADSLNGITRPVLAADANAVLDYVLNTEVRNGSIYGRIAAVASLQPDSVGDYGTLGTGAGQSQNAITIRHVAASKAFVRVFASGETEDLNSTEWDNLLDELVSCQALLPVNKTAIQALSDNQQSRATELGLPRISLSHISRIP